MEGGTVYLICFVSGILIQAGLVEFCCRVRAVLVRTISVDGSSIFSEGIDESGEMLMPRVEFLMGTRLSS